MSMPVVAIYVRHSKDCPIKKTNLEALHPLETSALEA
jgi:hypothetical protein